VQGAFAQGILSLETGFYDSRDDPDGRNPAIENSQLRALVGYQRALGSQRHTFFGQFDRNDNVYGTVRYSF
jgi:hypothetical protein